MKPGDSVEYRCGRGHVLYLRLTTLKPDPDRWAGLPCPYCSERREGRNALRRSGKVIEAAQ